MITRTQVLNTLATARSYKTYLEIGVGLKDNFNGVLVEHKESVDPAHDATYAMSSDDFFAGPGKDKRWDLIFIDGYHVADQVRRDIDNSLACLNEGGAVVLHDCLPPSEDAQRVPPVQVLWTGDVWKAWAWNRMYRPDLSMRVVDVDLGCGVIERGAQKCFPKTEVLDYQFLVNNKAELLNLVSWDTWKYFYVSGVLRPMEMSLDTPLREVLEAMQRKIMTNTSYFGVRAYQSPVDFWVYQELLYETKPDLIIEIGNACGGALLALAHLCDAMGKGEVLGIDVDHSAVAEKVKAHPRIRLIEGNALNVFQEVQRLVPEGASVMVIEDSSHGYENTLGILRLYSKLVGRGGYFIVEDGICHHGLEVGPSPGPFEAVHTFLLENPAFEADRSRESFLITWNPHGYLRRI